jgi:cytochrome P450
MNPSIAQREFDPNEFLDPVNISNPQPFWQRLRHAGPVVPGFLGDPRQVLLVRREDAEFALGNPEVFSAAVETPHLGSKRRLIPLEFDPPEHVKYRRILDPVFAPRQMAKLEDRVAALANEYMDRFEPRGRCEFRAELAVPLPSAVFLDLMGMPLSQLDMFQEMKDGLLHTHIQDFEEAERIRAAWAERVDAYFQSALDDRRRHRRDDLVSRLLDAEVDGQRLTDDEILGICLLLLTAGLDTVTNTLCCDLAYFAQHPEARQAIVKDPALIPSAVEELLRWESPVDTLARVTTTDTEIKGFPIPKGTNVGIALGAANIDDHAIPGADTVNLARDPNRHLAFGGGVHRCLGSHLARMELRVVLREWHKRIPDYHLAPGTDLVYTPTLRQVNHVPLVFGP